MRHSRHTARIAAGFMVAVALAALVAACGPQEPTSSLAQADTPIPPTNTAILPTSTPLPPTAPPTSTPTPTPVPPTDTPAPTTTPIPPTFTPTPIPPTETWTPAPTATLTPKPTKVPTARPRNTATPTQQAYPAPVLLQPEPDYDMWTPGWPVPEHEFSWSWSRTLEPNQYFQVQFIGPGNEHRGIHAPTKESSFSFLHPWHRAPEFPFYDWCSKAEPCHLQWTVVVVEWNGVDPGNLGRVLSEAEPRWFYY